MKNFFKKIYNWLKNLTSGDKGGIDYPPVEEGQLPDIEMPNGLGSLTPGDHGIDISHHNPSVNLSKVKEGQKFVFMKATEGGSLVSSTYHQRIDQAIQLGIPCGAYHYYRTNVEWEVQARHFLKHAKGDLPLVLDIEAINNKDFKARHTQDCLKILKLIEKETGKTPIVYTGYYFMRDTVKPSSEWSRYPLWLAWYTSDFSKVKCPAPWTKVNIWQYSEEATVSGVGKCDANIFRGL